jgi:hypothetical protein
MAKKQIEEEDIDFEAEGEVYKNNASSNMDELGLEDLSSGYVKHPKVGESVVIEIDKVFRDRNIKGTTKEGKVFKTSLSGVDFKYTFNLKDGTRYSPGSWEVWGKIRELMLKQKTTKIKVKIAHIKDGMKDDGKNNYEVTLIQ